MEECAEGEECERGEVTDVIVGLVALRPILPPTRARRRCFSPPSRPMVR